MLTDEQCDEFRRLSGRFNDMLRATHEAGRDAGRDSERKRLIALLESFVRDAPDNYSDGLIGAIRVLKDFI